MKNKKQKTGLALSGGATMAMAIFPIIEELEKLNIPINYISGTSAGAIIGAHYSLYGETRSLAKELLNFSKKEWMAFVDLTLANTKSLIKAKKYKEYLFKKFGDKTFEDLNIPLVVVATNLETGKVEYITKGKIVDALIASSAYPGIFPPYKVNNKILVDGGVLDNFPYNILYKKKMDRVVGINLSKASDGKREFTNIFSVLQRSMDLMIDNSFKNIYSEDQKLFVFDVGFKKGLNSSWSMRDLDKKYEAGLKTFDKRKKEFAEWNEE